VAKVGWLDMLASPDTGATSSPQEAPLDRLVLQETLASLAGSLLVPLGTLPVVLRVPLAPPPFPCPIAAQVVG